MKTFEIDGKEYQVRRPTQQAVEDVCRVMCQREDLTAEDKYHYAKIAGFRTQKDKAGNEYIEFPIKYTKSTYCDGLGQALFESNPVFKGVDRSVIHEAFGFFLNSFGETSHDVAKFYKTLAIVRDIPTLQSILSSLEDGRTDTGGE